MSHDNLVCLRFKDDVRSFKAYVNAGGYKIWRKILLESADRSEIIDVLERSGLRGRGGAWFPTAVKLKFMNPEDEGTSYLVINSDEGEPGTCKDSHILRTNPHQLIEGSLIASYALGVDVIYHYLRGEFKHQYDLLERCLLEVYEASLLGDDMLGSGRSLHFHNVLGAGSYIVGEETAMLESLEGKRALPRRKPPFPAVKGLYGRPTVINNTETLTSIPVILEKGSDWYRSLGEQGACGVKVFSVSGHVASAGIFELPLGTAFSVLLEKAGGVRFGRKLKAVIPGGTSMKVLPGAVMKDAYMDPKHIMELGSLIGTGGVIVLDEQACMVRALEVMMSFYHHESCGQCTPCREGSGWILSIIRRILHGRGKEADVDELVNIARRIEGRTICAFGEAMAWPVTSFIIHFREEFDYFVKTGHSLMSSKYGDDGFSWGASS